MDKNTIDASTLQKMFLAAAKGLESKKEWINELNVFPVPDGDTGTNMTMTILAAAREVSAIEKPDMKSLTKAISSGSLRGARGNSGVILSQLFRGFTKEIRETDTITIPILADAMVRATETAYKAVMKPKEGTILTVAKGMSDKAVELAAKVDDLSEFMRLVIEHGDYVLSQTPEMLPVLKQAGVVDSGGQGLMQVIKGAYDGFLGKEISLDTEPMQKPSVPAAKTDTEASEAEEFDIRFGYCTEFIINIGQAYDEETEHEFKAYLESIGDCVVVVSDEDIVKVHVHTNHPGLAFEKALTYGSLSRMKIDNMREEHQEKLIKEAEKLAKEQKEHEHEKEMEAKALAEKAAEPRKPYGFIAVSVGEGLSEIFKGIGADCLIEGGQTMNPSTEDMVNAIQQVNADTIFIFPNNKNIILAAEQAKYLVEDKEIIVVPSKTVPQGICALINFVPDLSAEENLEVMKQEMEHIKTGQITYAVRNTNIDGVEIHEHDIMALGDQGILAVSQTLEKTVMDALHAMIDEESELVTIYYGADVKEEDAEAILSNVQETFDSCEIEMHYGGQPIYYYLISVE
ncbi:MAG: DAK2 domain-containing protein [bacterium]|nr:DAK2 domain-containing protein [bacterium]